MQKYLATPQKRPTEDQKDLSPLPSILSHHQRSTKLQIMQSPNTPGKDLFSQLLSVEHTRSPSHDSAFLHFHQDHFQIMEEEDSAEQLSSANDDDCNEDDISLEDNDEDDLGMRKRKRKSTAQIKILKAELEHELNWNKDKIDEMAEQTGLSQSQVYKWWWDQKKKNVRHEREGQLEKRKMIRKDGLRKGPAFDKNTHGYYMDESMLTKPKTTIDIEETAMTQKKINKRLVFM